MMRATLAMETRYNIRGESMYEYNTVSIGAETFHTNSQKSIHTESQKGWRLVSVIPPPPEHPKMAISLFGIPLISILPQPRFSTSFGLRNQYKLIFERPAGTHDAEG